MNTRPDDEAWPVGIFLRDEMDERGWTVCELVARMGGGGLEKVAEIDMLLFNATQGVTLDKGTAADLAKVFRTSPDYWLNLDQIWQDYVGKDRNKKEKTENEEQNGSSGRVHDAGRVNAGAEPSG